MAQCGWVNLKIKIFLTFNQPASTKYLFSISMSCQTDVCLRVVGQTMYLLCIQHFVNANKLLPNSNKSNDINICAVKRIWDGLKGMMFYGL